MAITIDDIIKSVFNAMERQGMSLTLSEYTLIEEEANKIISDLLELKEKEEKLKIKFSVSIPCMVDKASFRNRTVRKFIKDINPAVEMEFELSRRRLTLVDSYDIFDGKISTFPCHMSAEKKDNYYSYKYEE